MSTEPLQVELARHGGASPAIADIDLSPRDIGDIVGVDALAAFATRLRYATDERSALDPKANFVQDLLDHMIYSISGLSDADIGGLEKRPAKLLRSGSGEARYEQRDRARDSQHPAAIPCTAWRDYELRAA